MISYLPTIVYCKDKQTRFITNARNKEQLDLLFKENNVMDIEPTVEYLNAFSYMAIFIGVVGLLGFKLVQFVEYLQQFLPLWAIVSGATLILFIFFFITLRLTLEEKVKEKATPRPSPKKKENATPKSTKKENATPKSTKKSSKKQD